MSVAKNANLGSIPSNFFFLNSDTKSFITSATKSPRWISNPGCASKTRKYSRKPTRSSTSQDDAYKDAAPKAGITGNYKGNKVATPSLLCTHLSEFTGPPLCRLTQLNGVPGDNLQHRQCSRFVFDTGDIAWEYLHMDQRPCQHKQQVGPQRKQSFRVLHAIGDFFKNVELPRGQIVQVTYNVKFLHKYEELKFNKGEAGTLHSQVGEGDAFLPSRKTVIFLAELTTRIEPLTSKEQPSSGSKIALFHRDLSNFLNAFHAFFFQVRDQQRTRSIRSSSESWFLQVNAFHAFFHPQARHQVTRSFKRSSQQSGERVQFESEKISSINGQDSAFNVRIYFEFKFKFEFKLVINVNLIQDILYLCLDLGC